ncbi:MAG TPA: inositol monophosphatase [Nitriliruptoraceae bacterium]|nr:inositol monophosphatase [Nitriliruptoraceae bacterium]
MDTSAHDHEPAPLPDDDALEVVMAARRVGHDLVDGLRQALLDGWGRSRRRDKADGTPVTEVDLFADRVIVAGVREVFPSHAVVSEEGSTTWDGTEWTWVVDPIDGTTNYSAGLPYWATSIALAHHGRVLWGMVDAPALDLRFDAVRGQGATANGQAAWVADEIDLTARSSRHSPLGVSAGTVRQVIEGTWFKPRILGAYALDLALVADGTLVGAFTRVPKVWDVAAGMLLVTEAGGGVVTVGAERHLPLVADTQLADRSVRTAAGPSAGWTARATERLWPLG